VELRGRHEHARAGRPGPVKVRQALGGWDRERHLGARSSGARGHRGERDKQPKLSCAERAGGRLRSHKVSTDRLNSTKINLAEQQHSTWKPQHGNRNPP